MKAVILAAGEGKRLLPYTLNLPKCLVKIEGKSLLERQIAILNKENIKDITIIGGHKVNKLTRKDINVRTNYDYKETNMLWTLFCAEDVIKDEVIVAYGDIVYSQKILKELLKSTSDISVVVDTAWLSYWSKRSDNPLNDAETLRIGKNNILLEIGQKTENIEDIEAQYIGLMKFKKQGISDLKNAFLKAKKNGIGNKSVKKAYMTDLLQEMIESGIKLKAVKTKEEWVEIDTVFDLNAYVTKKRLSIIDAGMK